MIFDKLTNCKQYYSLGEKIKKGFEFLLNNDLKTLKDGRYEILENEIYANIQTLKTKNESLKKWEVHREYLDIQYVISNKEKMGYGLLEEFKETIEEYDKEKDIEFLKGDKFNFINVSEGEFVIFYPNDVHAPMLSVKDDIEIKKVIVKVKL